MLICHDTVGFFGIDGQPGFPQGVIQVSDGNFYGATFFGGKNEEGSVFKLTPKGVLILGVF